MLERSQVTGLLLCGGASRRMGKDKALLPALQVPAGLGPARDLLGRSAGLLAERCGRVLLATGSGARYSDRGLEVVLDRAAGLGPLAGLEAGLRAATTPWVLAIPCDLPLLDLPALDGLLQAAADGDLPAGVASDLRPDIWHWHGGDQLQPLCCLVRAACADAAGLALDRGRRRVIAFWDEPTEGRPLRVHGLSPSESVRKSLWNVNTAAEWTAARSG